jgi:hypothetical protein
VRHGHLLGRSVSKQVLKAYGYLSLFALLAGGGGSAVGLLPPSHRPKSTWACLFVVQAATRVPLSFCLGPRFANERDISAQTIQLLGSGVFKAAFTPPPHFASKAAFACWARSGTAGGPAGAVASRWGWHGLFYHTVRAHTHTSRLVLPRSRALISGGDAIRPHLSSRHGHGAATQRRLLPVATC